MYDKVIEKVDALQLLPEDELLQLYNTNIRIEIADQIIEVPFDAVSFNALLLMLKEINKES